MLRFLFELLCGRFVRLDGPLVPFDDPGVSATPVPSAVPAIPSSGPAAAAPPQPADDWPVGAGRHANNCLFLDDPRHACLNGYGEPIRPGQDCWHSARAESLRSFSEAHPRWAPIFEHDIPKEATR